MFNNLPSLSSTRATMRHLCKLQGENPSLSDKIIKTFQSKMSQIHLDLMPEVWLLLTDCFGAICRIDDDLKEEFLKIAIEELSSTSPITRRVVINFLGEQLSIDNAPPDVLIDTMSDQDGRIRLSGVKAMLKMYERGGKLPMSLYSISLKLTQDTTEQVRRLNLRLLAAMSVQGNVTK